ncbi:MAG TPA: endonuclease/exonuclease/phosphatase family protein, partial [Planctomicrobium sp.]|nr:endonuclease/exonuclease/phosphatase family protein [Planctomicrobium sp.]
MKHLVAAVLALITLALVPPEICPADETTSALRVMSFNIRYGTAQEKKRNWDQRKQDVAHVIKEFSPDLLGTQETLAFQRDFLSGLLPGYVPFGAG